MHVQSQSQPTAGGKSVHKCLGLSSAVPSCLEAVPHVSVILAAPGPGPGLLCPMVGLASLALYCDLENALRGKASVYMEMAFSSEVPPALVALECLQTIWLSVYGCF